MALQRLFGPLVVFLLAALLPARAADVGSISGRVATPDGKGIADAVVFVQSLVATNSVAPKTEASAIMDQVDKTFVPGLLPIVVGTRVHFPNHDQIRHHVYSFSPAKTFELPLYKGEDAPPVLFDKVGVVKIGCNIHDWMFGIILVLPTSHFTATREDGQFALTDLQSGTYTLAVWHALSKLKPEETERTVQVGPAAARVAFTLPLAAEHRRPAMHGARAEP